MTKKMAIGIAAPFHAYQYYGGGEFLVDTTMEYLKAEGVNAKFFDPWKDKVENFDIIHFFGIGYFNYEFLHTVKSKKTKLIVTPIFPSMGGLKNLYRKIYHAASFTVPFLKTPPELMKRNAQLADVILAHAEVEKGQISNLLRVDPAKIRVVRYGADKKYLNSSPQFFINKYKVSDYALCVARFDSKQKNQLNLIRALSDSQIPLVFVGRPDKGMESYYSICKKEASPSTIFIDYLDNSDGMLGSCYAACRTFVVPSKFEYPSIAVMEAILAGCKRLAITRTGSIKEYYQGYAEYFNPYSLKDIRKVVLNIHRSEPQGDAAKDHFKNNNLWENYIKGVIGAYQSII